MAMLVRALRAGEPISPRVCNSSWMLTDLPRRSKPEFENPHGRANSIIFRAGGAPICLSQQHKTYGVLTMRQAGQEHRFFHIQYHASVSGRALTPLVQRLFHVADHSFHVLSLWWWVRYCSLFRAATWLPLPFWKPRWRKV